MSLGTQTTGSNAGTSLDAGTTGRADGMLVPALHDQAMASAAGAGVPPALQQLRRAGADAFVAGNAIFTAGDPVAEIAALRARCAEVA